MRLFPATSLLICCLLISDAAVAQQSSPQRDPQAIAIAQGALLAMGGANLPTIQDTVTQSAATFFDSGQPTLGTVTFKTRTVGQVRVEFVLGGATSTAVYNAGLGAMRNPDGTVRRYIPAQTLNKRADHLPLLSMLAEYMDPAVGVRLLGVETISGAPAWRIELQRQLTAQQDPDNLYSPFARCEVLVDQSSGLLVKIRYDIPSLRNLLKRFRIEYQYTEYRSEAGLLIPHTIVQYSAGHRLAVFQVSNFTVNNGLSDADFAVPR